jgi:hypothetical protein
MQQKPEQVNALLGSFYDNNLGCLHMMLAKPNLVPILRIFISAEKLTDKFPLYSDKISLINSKQNSIFNLLLGLVGLKLNICIFSLFTV